MQGWIWRRISNQAVPEAEANVALYRSARALLEEGQGPPAHHSAPSRHVGPWPSTLWATGGLSPINLSHLRAFGPLEDSTDANTPTPNCPTARGARAAHC